MKKIIPPIIVVALCLLILFLVLRGCQQTPSVENPTPTTSTTDGSKESVPSSVPGGSGQGTCDHNWTNTSCLTPDSCPNCGMIQDVSGKHSWQAASCTMPQHCAVCGATEGGLAAHTYEETGRVDPTSNQPGSKIFTCVCGDSYTQEIDPIVSEGLEFMGWGEGKCLLIGMGTCTDTELYIPAYHEGAKVVGINRNALDYCGQLVSVSIPDTVETIGEQAFASCVNLKKVTIAEGVSIIENSAFSGCVALTEITIPKSVTNIASSAFAKCTGLTSVKVHPDNPTYHSAGNCIIETGSKTLFMGIQNSIIPDDGSVTSIGFAAFSGCSTLTQITIPDSVVTICDYAFSKCDGLISVTIGNGVISIGHCVFDDCRNLTEVTVGSGLRSIGDSSFADCRKLSKITLPASLCEIGHSVFYRCQSLTEIRYGGTKDQWQAMVKGNDWDLYAYEYTVYCTDGELKK